MKNKKVLIIGNSARSMVCSAKKAGYTVYAIDRFGDVDMIKCADKAQNLGQLRFDKLADSFRDIDAVILGPGFEDMKFENSLNNTPGIMKEAGDKSRLPLNLESLDIPHPITCMADKTGDMGFPLMLKPIFGSGGMGNFMARDENDLYDFGSRNDLHEYIAQEFIEGIPCSASVISTGDDALVVALNEQLIGLPWLTRKPFAYCGNITPLHTKFKEDMMRYAKQIAIEFKLIGSNGVDFMLTDRGVSVLEINPRFQGSIDTVELSTGMNIFEAHVRSFAGYLPELKDSRCFAAKAIIFAEKELEINKKISDTLIRCLDKGKAADIPQTGTVIKSEEPVVSLLATAATRNAAVDKVKTSLYYIKRRTEA